VQDDDATYILKPSMVGDGVYVHAGEPRQWRLPDGSLFPLSMVCPVCGRPARLVTIGYGPHGPEIGSFDHGDRQCGAEPELLATYLRPL
jgi:hypothetical protein